MASARVDKIRRRQLVNVSQSLEWARVYDSTLITVQRDENMDWIPELVRMFDRDCHGIAGARPVGITGVMDGSKKVHAQTIGAMRGENITRTKPRVKLRALLKAARHVSTTFPSRRRWSSSTCILTPGQRLAALTANRVVYRDGLPVAALTGGKAQFLADIEAKDRWEAEKRLVRPAARGMLADLA